MRRGQLEKENFGISDGKYFLAKYLQNKEETYMRMEKKKT